MTGTYADLVLENPASGHGVLTGYGNWRFVVEAAVPNQTLGRFDDDTFDDDNFSDGWQWQDLSDRWRGAQWTRGREGLEDRPATGEATLTLANNDGALSVWNGNSTWPGAPTYLGPDVLVRMGWWDQVAGTWVPAFCGLIDEAEDQAAELDADQWTTWSLVETFAALTLVDGSEQPEAGAGEDSFARLERLLDDAQWPYGLGANFGGSFINPTLQATTLAGNRATEIYVTADTAFLDAFSDRSGRFDTWAKGYSTPWLIPGGSVHVGFTEQPFTTTISGDSYRLFTWAGAPPTITATKVGMFNRVAVARVGGSVIGAENQASIGLNGVSDYQRTDLLMDTDADIPAWLELFLTFFSDATVKMSDIELNTDQDIPTATNAFGALVALDIGLSTIVWRLQPRVAAWANTFFQAIVTGYTVNANPSAPSRAMCSATVHIAVTAYQET